MNVRSCVEQTFQTHDGVDLFYRHWPSTGQRRGCVVMFHRGHEHSGRMAHLVDELDMPDYDFFAWDARGHGKSPGVRGYSPSFGTSVRDVQTFVDHISRSHGIAPADMAVLAQSVGAVLVSTWAHDYAPKVRCLVLASPAFKVKLYVPFACAGLRLMQALRGNFFVNSYVKSKFLTHDVARQNSYDSDPLIARAISVNILLALYENAARVVKDAQAITIPTQLLISGADWVVHHRPQHDFFYNLGSHVKERVVLDGFFHDTLGEAGRAPAIAQLREFILRQFAQPLQRPDLKAADKYGETFNESMRLAEPLSLFSLRGLFWATVRLNMRIGGLISEGIRLGHKTGFDSGSTLDYVYRNQPQGLGALGRLADYFYINSIGWRGIRQRKANLMELLQKAVDATKAAGGSVRVMDIAAGHGRYVLEALATYTTRPDSILLRDYSDINVRDGTALIAEKGLQDVARFEKADAFDRASIAAVTPKPTIGIVSGLYELFPDNTMVGRSLAGLADAIEPGGYLLYTGQPWHPQLELIARALTSHRAGQAWIMRRRTQEEMDQLIEAAGFEKVEQRIDEWGIFSVSLARRKA
jgi:alpha-beta hydrolase superfamily lysophospholipase